MSVNFLRVKEEVDELTYTRNKLLNIISEEKGNKKDKLTC
jgi:hypothetical protein